MQLRVLAVLLGLALAAPAAAQAPGTVSISNLPNATTPLSGSELVPLVQSGTTVKTTASQFGGAPGGSTGQVQWNNGGHLGGFTLSNDCTLVTSTGLITCTKLNGVSPGTAFGVNTGTSGATIPLLNGINTWAAAQTFSAAPTLGSITGSAQCLHVNSAGLMSGTGSDCGSGGGGGTPGGTNGQIQFNSAGVFGGFTASGDATVNTSTGAVAVTKTGGVAFATSATTDTTNAANIGSGTLPAGRLPALTGDATTSVGTVATTVGKVNGVTYGTSPSTNTVPVVTGSNATTYEAVPNAALANSSITIGGQATALGGSTTNQGNGAKLQLSTGTTTTGHCVQYDANGNTTDAGAACSASGAVNWGPIRPSSYYTADTTGSQYFGYYQGAGGNAAPTDYGLTVVASLAANSTAQFRFQLPPFVPGGTCKLLVRALANATTGSIKYTVSDAVVAAGSNSPSAATLTAETQVTQTWAAAGNDKYNDNKLTLTGCSASANGTLVIAIVFNNTGWTLAQPVTFAVLGVIFE